MPQPAVGVVIGKGGEMIKKIQQETGAKVQFQQNREEGPGERRCILQGTPSQIEEARQRIEDLIESVMVRMVSKLYKFLFLNVSPALSSLSPCAAV